MKRLYPQVLPVRNIAATKNYQTIVFTKMANLQNTAVTVQTQVII